MPRSDTVGAEDVGAWRDLGWIVGSIVADDTVFIVKISLGWYFLQSAVCEPLIVSW